MQNQLRIWFYDPSTDPRGYFNKLVAFVDGPYCHCEIQFMDGTAYSVYMGSKIIRKLRTFDTTRYTCKTVVCNSVQYNQAKHKAETEYNQQHAFSFMMMTLALSPLSVASTDGTFCSKLVVDILQAADLLPAHVSSSNVSPSRLCRLLESNTAACTTSTQTHGKPVQQTGRIVPINFK